MKHILTRRFGRHECFVIESCVNNCSNINQAASPGIITVVVLCRLTHDFRFTLEIAVCNLLLRKRLIITLASAIAQQLAVRKWL